MPLELATPRPALDDAAVSAFDTDGVVALRGLVDEAGVAVLRSAVARAMATPSPFAQDFLADGGHGRYFSDLHSWRRDADLARMACSGALPAAALQMFGSGAARLFYDQIIVKDGGTASPTPWHHDLPFWPVTGAQVLSIWIALDPVTPDNGGVEYLRGSHRCAHRYRPTQPDTPATRKMRNMDLPPAPNFSRDVDADRIAWTMVPGDALIFSALTLHGAGPNRCAGQTRRAVVLRYIGDDARFVAGPHALRFGEDPMLADGAPFDGPLFPLALSA